MGNENLKVTIGKRNFFNHRTITYINSQNQKVSFQTEGGGIGAVFKVIQDELKDKSSFNISDIPNLLQKIETTFPPLEDYNFGKTVNNLMRHAIKDFTQDYSDGGKDITEKEIHQWYERIHSINNKYISSQNFYN